MTITLLLDLDDTLLPRTGLLAAARAARTALFGRHKLQTADDQHHEDHGDRGEKEIVPADQAVQLQI